MSSPVAFSPSSSSSSSLCRRGSLVASTSSFPSSSSSSACSPGRPRSPGKTGCLSLPSSSSSFFGIPEKSWRIASSKLRVIVLPICLFVSFFLLLFSFLHLFSSPSSLSARLSSIFSPLLLPLSLSSELPTPSLSSSSSSLQLVGQTRSGSEAIAPNPYYLQPPPPPPPPHLPRGLSSSSPPPPSASGSVPRLYTFSRTDVETYPHHGLFPTALQGSRGVREGSGGGGGERDFSGLKKQKKFWDYAPTGPPFTQGLVASPFQFSLDLLFSLFPDASALERACWEKHLTENRGTILLESSGLYDESYLREFDICTGRTLRQVYIHPTLFAEGVAYLWEEEKQVLYLLMSTWLENRMLVLDAFTWEELAHLQIPFEGWGLSSNLSYEDISSIRLAMLKGGADGRSDGSRGHHENSFDDPSFAPPARVQLKKKQRLWATTGSESLLEIDVDDLLASIRVASQSLSRRLLRQQHQQEGEEERSVSSTSSASSSEVKEGGGEGAGESAAKKSPTSPPPPLQSEDGKGGSRASGAVNLDYLPSGVNNLNRLLASSSSPPPGLSSSKKPTSSSNASFLDSSSSSVSGAKSERESRAPSSAGNNQSQQQREEVEEESGDGGSGVEGGGEREEKEEDGGFRQHPWLPRLGSILIQGTTVGVVKAVDTFQEFANYFGSKYNKKNDPTMAVSTRPFTAKKSTPPTQPGAEGGVHTVQQSHPPPPSSLIPLRLLPAVKLKGQKEITCLGKPLSRVNELEYVPGRNTLLGNIFGESVVVEIDVDTGNCQALLSFGALPGLLQSADRFNKVLNGIALLPSLTESRPPFVLSSLPYAETIPSSSSRRNEPFSLSSPSSRSSSSSEKPSLPATLVLTGKQWRELHEVELVELQTPRPLRTYSEVQKLFPGFFQREGVARPPR